MCVLLFDTFSGYSFKYRHVKHLLLRKTNVLKTSISSERKFDEMHWLWRAKRYKVYSGKRLFFLRFLICFAREIKGFCSLGNEVDWT